MARRGACPRYRTYAQCYLHPTRGQPARPLLQSRLGRRTAGKFELLVGGEDAGYLYERLLNIEEVEDVASLFKGWA